MKVESEVRGLTKKELDLTYLNDPFIELFHFHLMK